jgi:hypothetical protein
LSFSTKPPKNNFSAFFEKTKIIQTWKYGKSSKTSEKICKKYQKKSEKLAKRRPSLTDKPNF